MKKYIVIYNKNSRGKKYTKDELDQIFLSHGLVSKIFLTKQIKEVDIIIKKYINIKTRSFSWNNTNRSSI